MVGSFPHNRFVFLFSPIGRKNSQVTTVIWWIKERKKRSCLTCVCHVSYVYLHIFSMLGMSICLFMSSWENAKNKTGQTASKDLSSPSQTSAWRLLFWSYTEESYMSLLVHMYIISVYVHFCGYIFFHTYIYIYFRYNVYKIVTVMMLLESAIVNFCPFANLEADICHGVPLPISKHG